MNDFNPLSEHPLSSSQCRPAKMNNKIAYSIARLHTHCLMVSILAIRWKDVPGIGCQARDDRQTFPLSFMDQASHTMFAMSLGFNYDQFIEMLVNAFQNHCDNNLGDTMEVLFSKQNFFFEKKSRDSSDLKDH